MRKKKEGIPPIPTKKKKNKKWLWIILAVLFVAFLADPKTEDKKRSEIETDYNDVTEIADSNEPLDMDDSKTGDEPEISKEEQALIDISDRLSNGAFGPAESITTFDIKDRDSGHYRTEYRLFKETNGYSVVTSRGTFDIVDAKRDPRIYYSPIRSEIDNQPEEDIVYYLEAIDAMAKALVPDIDLDSLNREIANRAHNYELNGFYYGGVGIVSSKHDVMVKIDEY